MKIIKMLALALAFCMTISILPVLSSSASDVSTKKHTVELLMGDANLDGVVNTADAVTLLRYFSEKIDFTDDQKEIGDANMDNELNTNDAVYVLCICVGLAEQLTKEKVIYDKFNVSYVTGNTSTAAEPELIAEESEYTVAEAPVFEGYPTEKFIGWLLDADSKVYQPGEKITMPSKDIVFTAQWEAFPIGKVVVNMFDSFNEIAVETTLNIDVLVNGENVFNNSNVVLPEGYEFDGSFEQTVVLNDGVVTPSQFTVNVIPVEYESDEKYYVIKTIAGFEKVNNNLEANYILNNDIDLTDYNMIPFGWDRDDYFEIEAEFTGIFDGKDKTIKGLTMEYSNDYDGEEIEYVFYSNIGLFCVNSGTIKNLNIEIAEYTAEDNPYGIIGDVSVGAVAGINTGIIENCHVSGLVASTDNLEVDRGAAGGIAGTNSGTISKCSMIGDVEGHYAIGGIVGKNSGSISESYFMGSINKNYDDEKLSSGDYSVRYVGGICGRLYAGTIENSYAYITEKLAAHTMIGGVAGLAEGGSIKKCLVFNTAKMYSVEETYLNVAIGRIADAATVEQAAVYTSENLVINEGVLPEEFSAKIWTMTDGMPDLVNNMRA